MNVRRLLSLVVLVFVAVAARPVWAICTGAQEYRVSAAGSSLIIIPTNFQQRRCPDPAGMLRQNVDTGQVVKIDACIGTDGFLDECVPPGKYRYGLGMPYKCCQSCCKTEFFTELTIAVPPPANCDATRMPDKPRPMPYTGAVPWGNSSSICDYVPPPDAARPPSTAPPRPGYDAGDPGVTGMGGTGGNVPPTGVNPRPPSASGGCSVGGGTAGTGAAAALILGSLALTIGFLRLAERRRKTRS
jgi:hypothetical protein